MAKAELGTKRVCPVTGKKFYDLGRDPIISPYTGQSYPLTYFEPQPAPIIEDSEESEVPAGTVPVDIVPLEEAEIADDVKLIPDDDIDLGDDDDTFLEPEEDEDDADVSDLIDGDIEEDDEN